MSEMQETGTKKQYRFRITSIIIATVMLAGAFGVLIGPFTINVSAAPDTHTWSAAAAGPASVGGNWNPAGPPDADDIVIFDLTSTKNCTWDLVVSLRTFTVSAGRPSYSHVNFTADLTVTGDFTMLSGYSRGDAVHQITIGGNVSLTGSGAGFSDVMIVLTGAGKTYDPGGWWPYEVRVKASTTQVTSNVYPKRFIIEPGVTYTVTTPACLYPFLSDVNGVFDNRGVVIGTGTFQIAANYLASLSHYHLSIGDVRMNLELFASASLPANRTIFLNSTWMIDGDLQVRSGHATYWLTLDTAGYALTLEALTITTRGSLYVNSTITVTEDFTMINSATMRGESDNDPTCRLIVTGNVDLSGGGIGFIDVSMSLIGVGGTVNFGSSWWYELRCYQSVTQTAGSTYPKRFILNAGMTYTVSTGAFFYPFISDATWAFDNKGTITGAGTFQIATNYLASLSTYDLSIGDVDMDLEVYSSASVPGPRTIYLNDTWNLDGDLQIRSGDVVDQLTLDLSTHQLNANGLTVTTKGVFNAGTGVANIDGNVQIINDGQIYGGNGTVQLTGNWDSETATGTFICENGTISATGVHQYALFEDGNPPFVFNVASGASAYVMDGFEVSGSLQVDGSLSRMGSDGPLSWFLDYPQLLKFAMAHRGDNAVNRPENTMVAFTYALSQDLHVIEFDARRTNDAVFIVMHDGTWDRTTDGTGNIADTNWIGYGDGLDAGSYYNPIYASEHVPEVADVFTWAIANDVMCWIDAYYDSMYDAEFYALINSTGAQHNVVIQRATPASVSMFRDLPQSVILWSAVTHADYEANITLCAANDIEFITPISAVQTNAPNGYADAYAAGVGVMLAYDWASTDESLHLGRLIDGANGVCIDSAVVSGAVQAYFASDTITIYVNSSNLIAVTMNGTLNANVTITSTLPLVYVYGTTSMVKFITIDTPIIYINGSSGLKIESTASMTFSVSALSASGYSWSARSTSSITFTLSGLESGGGILYNVYVDGDRIAQLRPDGTGTISFSYSGPWSEHTFEVVRYDPWGPLYDMGPVMLYIGVIVGLTAIVLVMVGSRIKLKG